MARFNIYGWSVKTLLLLMISVLAFSIRCAGGPPGGRVRWQRLRARLCCAPHVQGRSRGPPRARTPVTGRGRCSGKGHRTVQRAAARGFTSGPRIPPHNQTPHRCFHSLFSVIKYESVIHEVRRAPSSSRPAARAQQLAPSSSPCPYPSMPPPALAAGRPRRAPPRRPSQPDSRPAGPRATHTLTHTHTLHAAHRSLTPTSTTG